MAAALYWASSINGGGTGSLDGIDPTDTDGSARALAVGDACIVVDEATDEVTAIYVAKSSAGQSEKYPDIIIPDSNPSNWYWKNILIKFSYEDAVSAALAYANIPGAF